MSTRYDGPIIDPHHHLWDLGLGRHHWLAPRAERSGGLGDLARLRRNYFPSDYLRDAAGHSIVATVHVEASWDPNDPLGETRWLDSLEKPCGVATRYVAHVSLASPDAAKLLDAQASFSRVVGVRDILSWSEDPTRRFAARGDLMHDPSWRASLAMLARHNLVFDLMVYSRQLNAAARMVRDFPNQLFVLNHCGSPIDRDAEGMRRWRNGLMAVAHSPNVLIKISDLVAYDHNWTLDSLREVVLRCIDSFAPERAMFASDFPVTGLHATFDQTYGAFKTIVSEFSADEQRALFFDNAKRTYRIDLERA
jgi:predicted TIM-barrel fold metal-dependent hydrolase